MKASRRILVPVSQFPVASHTFILREIRALLDVGHRVHILAASPGDERDWDQAAHFGITSEQVTYRDWRTSSLLAWGRNAFQKSVVAAADRPTYGRMLGFRRRSFFSRLLEEPEGESSGTSNKSVRSSKIALPDFACATTTATSCRPLIPAAVMVCCQR